MIRNIPVSPLALNQLTRAYWGQYDPVVAAQLAELANDPCYAVKFYKAPADDQEVFTGFQYTTYGMQITPGSIIYGLYLPANVDLETPTDSAPDSYLVQITDVSLEHRFFDEPVSSLLLSNFKPLYQSAVNLNTGSFPNLLAAPHPVVGSGLFDIEVQATPAAADTVQRIQIVLGVLEVCHVG